MIRSRSSFFALPADDSSDPEAVTPPSSVVADTMTSSYSSKCPNKCPTNRSSGITNLWKCLLLLLVFATVTYIYFILTDFSPYATPPISNANDGKLTIVMNTFRRNDLMTGMCIVCIVYIVCIERILNPS